jgi:hypothetical protein
LSMIQYGLSLSGLACFPAVAGWAYPRTFGFWRR